MIYIVNSAYAGLEHRGAFPPQAEAAAGMRVTEARKAGWQNGAVRTETRMTTFYLHGTVL